MISKRLNRSTNIGTLQISIPCNFSILGKVILKNALDAATLLSLKKYTFTVYNQFKCREAATEIILDIPLAGCPFAFSRYHYEVTLQETYPTSQTFLTIQTQPLTSSAIFSIVEVAARSLFQINPATGKASKLPSQCFRKVHLTNNFERIKDSLENW